MSLFPLQLHPSVFINVTVVSFAKCMQTVLSLLSGTGRIVSWGWNEHGNCGTGTEDYVRVPTPVGTDIKQKAMIIGTGAGQSFALNF
jgi:alpha-tubulin suppressor-like RCC1 family protein